MEKSVLEKLFSLKDKVVVVTGGGGFIAGAMARAIAICGAKVAVIDIIGEAAEKNSGEIRENGGDSIALTADVLDKSSLEDCCQRVVAEFGKIDGLINGAGGNKAEATTSEKMSFFDIPAEANKWVFDLNFTGTFLSCQVFGREIVKQQSGSIVNIASIAGYRPMSRVAAYSAAKAATINFTAWLAVHMCQNYSAKIRVNAIAPGACVTEQNRYLLFDASDKLSNRGRDILKMVPQRRFGEPSELVGAAIWLLSDLASFVTGSVITIDGGFDAFSGV